MDNVFDFIKESNRIEGIHTLPTSEEVMAYRKFLDQDEMTLDHVIGLVSVIQPGAILRDRVGLDVRVGSYFPPRGAPELRHNAESLIILMNKATKVDEEAQYMMHKAYESLHPFTDGNGRSGRALWLWMRGGYTPLGFLHQWYYQSLKYG